MKNYLTDTDRKIMFRLGALLIALLIGCAFPHQRMLICALLFAVVGIFGGIGGALVGLIIGFIVSFNALVLGIVTAGIMYFWFRRFSNQYKVSVNGDTVAVVLCLAAILVGLGGNVYQHHLQKQEQAIEYRRTHPTKVTAANVKQRIETEFDNTNLDVKKVKVTGFKDYGGGVIITLDSDPLQVDKSDVNAVIADTCKAISTMNYKKFDGVNIKVVATDPAKNHPVVGYANVDMKKIKDVNKNNVANVVSEYQNSGQH